MATPHILPICFSCASTRLTTDEIALFKQARPLGLILFARNIESTEQIHALNEEFKNIVQHDAYLTLIDQEGGRVRRLRPPEFHDAPAMAHYGRYYRQDPEQALQYLKANIILMAQDLLRCGFNVNCTPICDLALDGYHDIIGDRAFGDDAHVIATLSQFIIEILADHGIMGIIKHIPGHGRALVDSHEELPIIDTAHDILSQYDFKAFALCNNAPAAMSAHIIYHDIDRNNCATQSPIIINDIIRAEIGFQGLLFSDDLCMNALKDVMIIRAQKALQAGCDILLHCNGDLDEMSDLCAYLDAMPAHLYHKIIATRSKPIVQNHDIDELQQQHQEFITMMSDG